MSTERTPDEVKAEIRALKACLTFAPPYSIFGDDNHRNIRLQIEFLEGEIDTTAAEFFEFSESEQSAILEASYWQEGSDDDVPSAGWELFRKLKTKETKKAKKA